MFFFKIRCLLLALSPNEASRQLIGFDVMSHILPRVYGLVSFRIPYFKESRFRCTLYYSILYYVHMSIVIVTDINEKQPTEFL